MVNFPVAELSEERRSLLQGYALGIAGSAIEGSPEPGAPALGDARVGCLVSLRRGGEPCGFLGSLEPRPIGESVALAARLAATDDPRYEPGRLDGEIEARVWLVGDARPVDGPDDLSPSDGVMVRSGLNRAIHLPGLPSIGEGATAVLASACVAADLHPEAWRRDDVEIRAFPVQLV